MKLIFEREPEGDAVPGDGRAGTLVDAARRAGIELDTRCGGRGTCGRCRVRLLSGVFRVKGRRVAVEPGRPVLAPACQTRALSGELRVSVPLRARIEPDAKIEEEFAPPGFRVRPRVRAVVVPVPDALAESPVSDRDRVDAAVRKADRKDGNLLWPVEALRALPDALRNGNGRVAVALAETPCGDEVLDVTPADAPAERLGLAADIGTTTVVAALVDLDRGEVLTKASMWNAQIARADDVASRISACRTEADLEEMRERIVERTLNALIRAMCRRTGRRPRSILRAAVSGNTVMTHLFLGLSPAGLGRLPFVPVACETDPVPARDIGLEMHPRGRVEIVPCIAAYLGGDVTSDLAVSGLMDTPGLALLADIGTNGEIVLSGDGRMIACATAAGPAFEGAGTACGCRAAGGAIERLRIGPDLDIRFQTIGSAPPVGICGSGLVDFLAQGLLRGLIDRVGRLDIDWLRARGRYLKTECNGRPAHACLIVPAGGSGTGEPIWISEADIAQALKAKAAVFAAMKTLLGLWNRTFPDLARIVLAGGFARHLDLRHAMDIGLLPEVAERRIERIGNGSLAGAFLALVDAEARDRFCDLRGRPVPVELNRTPGFEANYCDALAMPHLDESGFPAARARLLEGRAGRERRNGFTDAWTAPRPRVTRPGP